MTGNSYHFQVDATLVFPRGSCVRMYRIGPQPGGGTVVPESLNSVRGSRRADRRVEPSNHERYVGPSVLLEA